jgi:hypothetical protein
MEKQMSNNQQNTPPQSQQAKKSPSSSGIAVRVAPISQRAQSTISLALKYGKEIASKGS